MRQGIYERRKQTVQTDLTDRYLALYDFGTETGAILLVKAEETYTHDEREELPESILPTPIKKLTNDILYEKGITSANDGLRFVDSDLSQVVLGEQSIIRRRLVQNQQSS